MLTITLLTDGSSDRCLLPVIEWSLREAGLLADLDLEWADLRHLRTQPVSLAERINVAVDLYPCEVVIVHRDSEGEALRKRVDEIGQAVQQSEVNIPHVPIVTIRMQEAWLLIDEDAIRAAAGNPSGSTKLNLPPLDELESTPDPKFTLFEAFRIASELNGRRRRKLDVHACRLLVTRFMDDFSGLRQLQGFISFEESLRALVMKYHLNARRD